MRSGTSGELWGDRPYTKILIYGETGSGKTWWAAGSPRPLFLLREVQALQTITARRPDAQVVILESYVDFVEAFNKVKLASTGKSSDGQPYCKCKIAGNEFIFQTLVVDSFTDIQKLMISSMGKSEGVLSLQGNYSPSLTQWGRILDICDQVLRDQRAIPCNTVFVCLAVERYDADQNRRMIPSLSGKRLPTEIGQYFNAVGLAHKTRTGRHMLLSSGDSRFVTKPAPGWPSRVPNTLEAGNVTLGSLLLWSQRNDVTVSHEEDDSAQFVDAYMASQNANKEDSNE